MTATLRIASLTENGDQADATVTGTMTFVGQDRRSQVQPVSFRATLERAGAVWLIKAIN